MAPRKTSNAAAAEAPQAAENTNPTPPPSPAYVHVVMTCPLVVDLRATAPGDRITTDPDTAARLIAAGYAVPTDDDQEAI